jgi:uncharacterized protein YneF (UPF0154 family)
MMFVLDMLAGSLMAIAGMAVGAWIARNSRGPR